MQGFLTIEEMFRSARRRLAPDVWDYLVGGAESETTLRRNRHALDSLAFRPRILVDVGRIDASAQLLGEPLRVPVVAAPVGSVGLFDKEGALAVARASDRFGIDSFISVMASPGLEAVAAASRRTPIFQLYARWDHDELVAIGRRAREAGYRALCLTVDAPYYGRRERDLMNRFAPHEAIDRPNLDGQAGPATSAQACFDWERLARLRDALDLPIVLKGVMTPEDALLAVEHGVSAVYVSNHGGRQIDHAQATIEVLPEIVDAVAGRAEIVVDGGFVRGSDVIKAIALGAAAVGMGRLIAWALAAAGEPGVVRALEILEDEIVTTMGLLGVTSLDQLDSSFVVRAQPTTLPCESAAFASCAFNDRS